MILDAYGRPVRTSIGFVRALTAERSPARAHDGALADAVGALSVLPIEPDDEGEEPGPNPPGSPTAPCPSAKERRHNEEEIS